MRARDYKYHLEMMLSTLEKTLPQGGDTRMYLDLDLGERAILIDLIGAELKVEAITLRGDAK